MILQLYHDKIKLLYVAPERLGSERFLSLCKALKEESKQKVQDLEKRFTEWIEEGLAFASLEELAEALELYKKNAIIEG